MCKLCIGNYGVFSLDLSAHTWRILHANAESACAQNAKDFEIYWGLFTKMVRIREPGHIAYTLLNIPSSNFPPGNPRISCDEENR